MGGFLPGGLAFSVTRIVSPALKKQAELASKIGVAESSISRFLNGSKNKLTIEQIISIARIFNVSSDFLLCLTDVPDKKNYDISELGLSAEAARNLYTGRVNPEVISRLLENRRFAQLTNMIALYFDETMASGFAAQNQILQSLSSMLLAAGKEQLAAMVVQPISQMGAGRRRNIIRTTASSASYDGKYAAEAKW